MEEIKIPEKCTNETLQYLQEQSFNSLKSRQGYEWRLSLSIWTALSILVGFTLKGDVSQVSEIIKWSSIPFGFIIASLHFSWLFHAGKRTKLDIAIMLFWEKQIRTVIQCDYEKDLEGKKDDEVIMRKKALRSKNRDKHSPLNYSLICQGLITILLSVALSASLFFANSKDASVQDAKCCCCPMK